jgi:ABC-2 type transport system ATP-binding protein
MPYFRISCNSSSAMPPDRVAIRTNDGQNVRTMPDGRDSDVSLRVSNITKRFGDFTAVEDLSFDVRAGRVFGFLGPNGAGKTTTIRMIVGITAPDEGSIELFGEHMSHTLQNRIGYLPEERGLYKKMKVVDQLKYFAELKGVSGATAEKKIDFWLERMGLAEWKKKKTTDLSKGMQQKIQFISTVLHDPDLLILDEPFSGLDPVNVEFMIDVLSEFRSEEKTVIFSTHLMSTAERLCHDILLINKARKVVGGSLREVKESYGTNLIAFRGTGAEKVLADKSLVERVVSHADEQELHLADGIDPQRVLKALMESAASVSKFEITEPSLNDIFIEKVGLNSPP